MNNISIEEYMQDSICKGHHCKSDIFDLDCKDCKKQALIDHDKQIRTDALDIDMDKPMHFTDEQKAWIKNYIIINAKRQRADAIEELLKAITDNSYKIEEDYTVGEFARVCIWEDDLQKIAEQLKEQTE